MDENKEKKRELNFDEMLEVVGAFGKYQKVVNVILCVMTVPPVYQVMMMYFAADEPPWRCTANSTCRLNGTFQDGDRHYIDRCDMPRTAWEFTQPRDYSIVTHFDIYCKTEWMVQLLTSIFFLGWLTGAFVLGICADNFGRKIVVVVSITTVLTTGFVSIFMPNLYLLIVCRFIIGFFIPGTFTQMFIIISEIVDSIHRPLAGIMIFVFALSTMSVLGVKAYFIRDWRYLHIACTVPYLFVVLFFKFLPESPRFLRVKGRTDELKESFQKIAQWNKREIPANVSIAPLPSTHSEHKSNPLHLFRTPILASRTLIQTFAYFTNGLVYYGLYLAAADLGGKKYRDYIIISITEVPICFIGIDFCERYGRKKTSVLPMLIGAVACIALGFIPKGGWKSIMRVIVGMLGKCLIGSNSNTMTTWSMEMYPTTLRGEAMGFFQAFMRLGAATSPWIDKEFAKLNKSASYLFMASLGLVSFFLLGMLPETKGVATQDTEDDEEREDSELNGIELSVTTHTNGALDLMEKSNIEQ